ncbi:MAG: YigZ family protein [Paludibacteraceae bacterium]|nr:YigZ family protein [Paludibacteraceae bacterium]
MLDTYRTIETPAEGLYKDKGSKFLSFVFHVDTAEQAMKIVADIRKKYYDARHICYAYMLGAERTEFRVNDDGEPSGTAGRPILGQINSNELTNLLIVVVRYFGGILLGTSGLITAYKSAAANAIENAEVVEKVIETQYYVRFGYQQMSYVMRTLKELNANIIQQIQQETCEIQYTIRNSNIQQMETKFTNVKDVTHGKINSN